MKGGCLGYPRASKVASQPLHVDRVPTPWLANPRNPAMSPHSRHLSTLTKSVEGKIEGWWGGGMLETSTKPLKQPTTNKLLDNSKKTAVTHEPALVSFTTDQKSLLRSSWLTLLNCHLITK